MNKPMDMMSVVERLARAERRWWLYLSMAPLDGYADSGVGEAINACPILASRDMFGHAVALATGDKLAIPYDTEAEAWAAFDSVVGEDGPTKSNPYKGPARVFAYLCGPDGGITENT